MNVYALATVQTAVDLLRLVAPAVHLRGLIGLSERSPTDAISGYSYMAPVASELGIEFTGVQSYSLTSEADRERLLQLDIDVLLVCGWQRLIPKWLIDHCRIGVLGFHGSAEGISRGRGRSPQNWAILLGAAEFEIALFLVTPGVDAGPVIATRKFPLSEHDDIVSSYLKCTMMSAEMVHEAFLQGRIKASAAQPQEDGGFYLPQRTPGDGQIDWKRSTKDLLRFIRALTRPYPGAFTFVDGMRLTIWRARPFDPGPDSARYKPGEIVLHAYNGSLVVAASDGLLLIDEFSVAGCQDNEGPYLRGRVCESCDFSAQMQQIIERHQQRYPAFPLSQMILKAPC